MARPRKTDTAETLVQAQAKYRKLEKQIKDIKDIILKTDEQTVSVAELKEWGVNVELGTDGKIKNLGWNAPAPKKAVAEEPKTEE